MRLKVLVDEGEYEGAVGEIDGYVMDNNNNVHAIVFTYLGCVPIPLDYLRIIEEKY